MCYILREKQPTVSAVSSFFFSLPALSWRKQQQGEDIGYGLAEWGDFLFDVV